jgi:hypothetical protein
LEDPKVFQEHSRLTSRYAYFTQYIVFIVRNNCKSIRYFTKNSEVTFFFNFLYNIYFFRFGTNVKRIPKIKSLFELILEALSDKILIILLIAATVSLAIGIAEHGIETGWIDGASIYLAVVAIVAIGSGNNWVKEKQF